MEESGQVHAGPDGAEAEDELEGDERRDVLFALVKEVGE